MKIRMVLLALAVAAPAIAQTWSDTLLVSVAIAISKGHGERTQDREISWKRLGRPGQLHRCRQAPSCPRAMKEVCACSAA